jgi:hypothetical protein
MDVAVKVPTRGLNCKDDVQKELEILERFPNPYLVQLLGWDMREDFLIITE